jgi:hypothetical protein
MVESVLDHGRFFFRTLTEAAQSSATARAAYSPVIVLNPYMYGFKTSGMAIVPSAC